MIDGYDLDVEVKTVAAPSGDPYTTGPHDGSDPRPDYRARALLAVSAPDAAPGDELLFVDKLFPHTAFDLMVVATSDRSRAGVVALTEGQLDHLAVVIQRFVDYCQSDRARTTTGFGRPCAHIAFNFDPFTVDRDNPMAYDKRFHLHLNCWDLDAVEQGEGQMFGQITDPVERRDLADPMSVLSSQLAPDLFGGRVANQPIVDLTSEESVAIGLPLGVKIRFADMGAVTSADLAALLAAFHEEFAAASGLLREALTGSRAIAPPWQRSSVLPLGEIDRRLAEVPVLGDRSREVLLQLATEMRSISPSTMDYLRSHRSAQLRCVALMDLAYSLGICGLPIGEGEARGFYVVLQPKLFSRLGGAGLAFLPGWPVVRVRRGGRPYSAEELVRRRVFQEEFLAAVDSCLAADERPTR